jgi:hypothetical protein
MNNSESAKKGFRTFILTLSVSLLVFSAVYYLLTTYTPQKEGTEGQTAVVVKGTDQAQGEPSDVQGAKDERTVFGDITAKKPQDRPKEVLAGATSSPETTQSTTSVPTTGYVEMTVGLILSLTLFIGAMIYNMMNPRKLALSRFEKKVLGKSE